MHAQSDASAEIASPQEAIQELLNLSPADALRAEGFSRIRSLGLNVDASDLLQESARRILSGGRRWPRNVPFIAFLLQTIRSIADEERHKQVASATSGDPSGDYAPDQAPDPHAAIEAKSEVWRIVGIFRDDPDVLALLEGLRLGETAAETQAKAGISDRAYHAARKRLRRAVTKLEDSSGAEI